MLSLDSPVYGPHRVK
uniref:Uncharacterized protein n=1 Tax=Anguilla anguilla TaxID=7936 RepID=A0A0E9W0Z9_ANGAN